REKFQQVQILFARFGQATSWFTPELLAIPWDTMQEWLTSSDEFAPYRHNIEDTYRQQQHVLDEEKEELLALFNQFTGTPADIHEALTTADMEYPRVSFNGVDTVTLTPGEYYSTLTYDRSQENRKKAHEAFYGAYFKDKNTYSAIYNAILQRDWAAAQSREYESTLGADLDGDNVPTEVYETLVNTVKAGTEPVKRYYEARRKALDLEEYHLYDGSVAVVDFDKKYDFDEITDWIVESVEPLG
ncbi:MAG: oligoendopeptidase F family protein, partial [FCB group bacterium]|nr:oligoendopeptidase F family protein [FCB group bacterium]